jgi:hypothetical protein
LQIKWDLKKVVNYASPKIIYKGESRNAKARGSGCIDTRFLPLGSKTGI